MWKKQRSYTRGWQKSRSLMHTLSPDLIYSILKQIPPRSLISTDRISDNWRVNHQAFFFLFFFFYPVNSICISRSVRDQMSLLARPAGWPVFLLSRAPLLATLLHQLNGGSLFCFGNRLSAFSLVFRDLL